MRVFVVLGVTLLLLFPGCSEESAIRFLTSSEERIEFQPDIPGKGTAVTEVADGSSFGVSAWYTDVDGTYYDRYSPVFSNTAINRNGDSYFYDDPVYWPADPSLNIRFFGWYPYRGVVISGPEIRPPQLSFQVASEVTEQVDLLYGVTDPLNNFESKAPVSFDFHHALTRIHLAVKFADDVPDGYKMDVMELYLSGHDKGTMTFPATPNDTPKWTLDPTSWHYYNLSAGLINNTGITAVTPREAVNITAPNYDLFMVPQTMTRLSIDEGNMTGNGIRIKYRLENDKLETDADYRYIENTVEISLAGQEAWQAGQSVVYTVVIGPRNASVVLQVGDWQDGNVGNEEISFE